MPAVLFVFSSVSKTLTGAPTVLAIPAASDVETDRIRACRDGFYQKRRTHIMC